MGSQLTSHSKTKDPFRNSPTTNSRRFRFKLITWRSKRHLEWSMTEAQNSKIVQKGTPWTRDLLEKVRRNHKRGSYTPQKTIVRKDQREPSPHTTTEVRTNPKRWRFKTSTQSSCHLRARLQTWCWLRDRTRSICKTITHREKWWRWRTIKWSWRRTALTNSTIQKWEKTFSKSKLCQAQKRAGFKVKIV